MKWMDMTFYSNAANKLIVEERVLSAAYEISYTIQVVM
jgi:hypothetical protein